MCGVWLPDSTVSFSIDAGRLKSAVAGADARGMEFDPYELQRRHEAMRRPPVSNAQRQREFLQRNPDYYKLRRAKQKAEVAARAAAAAVAATEPKVDAALTPPPRPEQLALPAPELVFTIQIPRCAELQGVYLADAVPQPPRSAALGG